MENIDKDAFKTEASRRTLQEELLMDEFHLEEGENGNIIEYYGTAYRIIEDKLTGEFFKVTKGDNVVEVYDGKFITMDGIRNTMNKLLDDVFGTSITEKKKYKVFLRIHPEQGSCGYPFVIKELEVMATDKEDAEKQWVKVYGEPFYNYPIVEEMK